MLRLSRIFLLYMMSLIIGMGNLSVQAQSAPFLSAPLKKSMETYPDSMFAIALVLEEQLDYQALEARFQKKGADLPSRAKQLIRLLQQNAFDSQSGLLSVLYALEGVEPSSIRPLWINNTIFLRANQAAILQIIQEDGLAYILPDVPVEVDSHISHPENSSTAAGVEIGLKRIQAPTLWAMGYTGYGQSVFVIDTGVDSTHPALSEKYRSVQMSGIPAWFDADLGTDEPTYCDDHGTHVLGTILGLDPNGSDTIGVAFGATWMGSPAICNGLSSDNLAAFQWALNPDGDPATVNDIPTVINNSWRATDIANECIHPLYGPALDALEAAGIAVVFSAGNGGPDSASITPPKNINHSLVNTFTVAAVNGISPDLNILSFSSRGPSSCPDTASLRIKPEVAAPGFQVRSATLGGAYERKSGTSMAAPHVSGAILLLKEAFPYLTGTELKKALYFSCTDLGETGEDNEYGMGLINVVAAFQYLENLGHVPVAVSSAYDPGIIRIQDLPEVLCDSVVQPTILIENHGTESLHMLSLHYQYSTGVGGNLNWSGQLDSDSILMLSIPTVGLPSGLHSLTVSITQINGGELDYHDLDNEKQVHFQLFHQSLRTASPLVVCTPGDALVYAETQEGGTIKWFSTLESQTPLFEGNGWFISQPSTPAIYYANIFTEAQLGEADISTGTGGYDPGTNGKIGIRLFSAIPLEIVVAS